MVGWLSSSALGSFGMYCAYFFTTKHGGQECCPRLILKVNDQVCTDVSIQELHSAVYAGVQRCSE